VIVQEKDQSGADYFSRVTTLLANAQCTETRKMMQRFDTIQAPNGRKEQKVRNKKHQGK